MKNKDKSENQRMRHLSITFVAMCILKAYFCWKQFETNKHKQKKINKTFFKFLMCLFHKLILLLFHSLLKYLPLAFSLLSFLPSFLTFRQSVSLSICYCLSLSSLSIYFLFSHSNFPSASDSYFSISIFFFSTLPRLNCFCTTTKSF